jgi:hypothetical protein
MAVDLEVGTLGEFGWLVIAAFVAGFVLYVWDQVKGKVGVTV